MTDVTAQWREYLREVRRREVEALFLRCPANGFARGLELGAGDGYQSTLLAPFVAGLVATDYRPAILAAPAHPRVTYRVCDAERVAASFAPGEFDLVFSSNLLEHLPDPQAALAGVAAVLACDGLALHIVPSPFWKFCHIAGFYPNLVRRQVRRLRRLVGGRGQEQAIAPHPERSGTQSQDAPWDNNPKLAPRRYGYLRRLLAPTPHGVSAGNLAEFRAFSVRRWRAEFARAGFDVVAVRKGPVTSGYGFNLHRLRRLLERAGFTSEYIYITVGGPVGGPDKIGGSLSPRLAERVAWFV